MDVRQPHVSTGPGQDHALLGDLYVEIHGRSVVPSDLVLAHLAVCDVCHGPSEEQLGYGVEQAGAGVGGDLSVGAAAPVERGGGEGQAGSLVFEGVGHADRATVVGADEGGG